MDGLAWFLVILAVSILLAFCVAAILVGYILQKRKKHKVTVANSCTDTSSRDSDDIAASKKQPRISEHVFHGLPTNQKHVFEAPPPPMLSPEIEMEQIDIDYKRQPSELSPGLQSNGHLSFRGSKEVGQRNDDNSIVVVVNDTPSYNPYLPYGIQIGKFGETNIEIENEVGVDVGNSAPMPKGKIQEVLPKPSQRPYHISLPESKEAVKRKLSPIRLQNFPQRLDELNENESEKLYEEFELIGKNKPSHATAFSSSQTTRRNRFYDIVPFEYNRVVLKYNDGTDYINASYITDIEGNTTYISAQGPIGENECVGGRRDATISDFWRMILQENVDCIVMLTQLVEGMKTKCSPYWPENVGETMVLNYGMSVNFYCIVEDENSFQREFLLFDGSDDPPKKVLQWHFKGWKDGAAPENKAALLHFIRQIRVSPHSLPILVHCSAGVGRTGVYMAVDQLLNKLENDKEIDVFGMVRHLRAQRSSMVQNIDQYATIYDVISLAVRQKLGQEKDKDDLTSLDRNKWLSDDNSLSSVS